MHPDERRHSRLPARLGWTDVALALTVVLGTALASMRNLRHLRRRDADRHALARSVASAAAVLALARALVSWDRVPVASWCLAAGFALAGLIAATLAWSTTPGTRGSRPARRRLATLSLLAWYACLVAATV